MSFPQDKNNSRIERLVRDYFSNPERRVSFRAGETILEQGQETFRLYLVLSGKIIAYQRSREQEPAGAGHEVFRAEAGSFIGVMSFFSQCYSSASRLVAESDVELAYIDNCVSAVRPQRYGSLIEQFVPAMLQELNERARRILDRTVEKDAAIRRMHRSEMSATLGQLAAGIAHELNNAIGVLARKTDFVAEFFENSLSEMSPERRELYKSGLEYSAVKSSEDMRTRARKFEREFDISQNAAKVLARVAETSDEAKKLGKKFISALECDSAFWELGHDLHDMRVAAKHAAAIVRSVKLLGGGNNIHRDPGTSVHESLCEAISLLKSHLREIKLVADIGERDACPTISADMTELVQIWVNVIKNACDALKLAGTPEPTVSVSLRVDEPAGTICVQISDNGPGIPESHRQKIFQPDFTTKKNGLQFGLGLGLAIVRRLVDAYNGEIALDSAPGKTTFSISLPYKK